MPLNCHALIQKNDSTPNSRLIGWSGLYWLQLQETHVLTKELEMQVCQKSHPTLLYNMSRDTIVYQAIQQCLQFCTLNFVEDMFQGLCWTWYCLKEISLCALFLPSTNQMHHQLRNKNSTPSVSRPKNEQDVLNRTHL